MEKLIMEKRGSAHGMNELAEGKRKERIACGVVTEDDG